MPPPLTPLRCALLASLIGLSACQHPPEHIGTPARTDAPASAGTQEDTVVRQFTAYGVGSSWRLLIDGDTAHTEGPELPAARVLLERSAYARGVEFSGTLAGQPLDININGRPCTDASRQRTEFSVTVHHGSRRLKGCAVRGIVPAAPT
ncbi:MAG: hypothetical protein Q4E06_02295 [Lautropia sp.]|nr:hypothetical protein [Lautropia sp.]